MAEQGGVRESPLLHPGGAKCDGEPRRRWCRCFAQVQPLGPERSLTPSLTPSLSRVLTRQDTGETPYSLSNDLRYFFRKGIPLGLSAMLNWGLPSLVGMVFAGHAHDSAHLQAAVGYGRVWYNVTAIVPLVSMISYAGTMIPSCIGAKRSDRVLEYLRKSLMLSLLFMIPVYILQLVSGPILVALGIPHDISVEVAHYNRIMIITNLLSICGMHMECLVVNLGYAKVSTVVALCSGGLQVLSSYTFLYRLEWGMPGNAIGGIMVELGRCVIFLTVIFIFGLWKKRPRTDGVVVIPHEEPEPVLAWKDLQEFLSFCGPQFLSNLAGWVVFEFQMLALANIKDISPTDLAAGAAWVQLETALAAAQQGWIQCVSMRTVQLLGQGDVGAPRSYALFSALSLSIVAISNVFLFIYREDLCAMVSNDPDVQQALSKIFWVLFIHTQTRICSIISVVLLIPLGRGRFQILWTFASFYLIASPFAGYVAMTDHVTESTGTKMLACVGLTSIAQIAQLFVFFFYLMRMDWLEASNIISARVNSDRQEECAQRAEAGELS